MNRNSKVLPSVMAARLIRQATVANSKSHDRLVAPEARVLVKGMRRNEPCYCGSGLKFKACCKDLSPEEKVQQKFKRVGIDVPSLKDEEIHGSTNSEESDDCL